MVFAAVIYLLLLSFVVNKRAILQYSPQGFGLHECTHFKINAYLKTKSVRK